MKEFGLKLADVVQRSTQTTKERKSKKSSTKTTPVIHTDAKELAVDDEESHDIYNANFAVAVLGGSKAPVDPNSSASLLDGELLVLQMQAPTFDGSDLAVFLLSEREYGKCFILKLTLLDSYVTQFKTHCRQAFVWFYIRTSL